MLSANFKKPLQNFSENKYTKIAVGVITVLIPVCFLIAAIIGFFQDFDRWKYQFESLPILSTVQYLQYFAIIFYANSRLFFEKEKIGRFKFLLKMIYLMALSLLIALMISFVMLFVSGGFIPIIK